MSHRSRIFHRVVSSGKRLRLVTCAVAVVTTLTLLGAPAPIYAGGVHFLRYVSPVGSDAHNICILQFDPCLTIGHALNEADAGDTIIVGTIGAGFPGYIGHLKIDKDITIIGRGGGKSWLTGNDAASDKPLIHVLPHTTVKISGLNIQQNHLTLGNGAGIRNEGTLTLESVGVQFNKVTGGGDGGGIYNDGTLTMKSTFVDKNSARNGGGIDNQGTLTIESGGVELDHAQEGGGIYNRGTLNLKGSKIQQNTAGDIGGGLYNNDATAAIANAQIETNSAQDGAGIYTSGKLTLIHSILLLNTALSNAGGIYTSGGPADLTDVRLLQNSAGADGGGVLNQNFGFTLTLNRVTFNGNIAGHTGGGLDSADGTAKLTNVTFYDNHKGTGEGPNIYNGNDMTLTNVTVVPVINLPGGGLYNANRVQMKNSIISDVPYNDSCAGKGLFVSLGHNLGDAVCGLKLKKQDLIGVKPKLGTFGNNGGYTETYSLDSHSPAVDHGTNNGCPAVDQRRVARPQDGDNNGSAICDIGAFEFPTHVGDTDH